MEMKDLMQKHLDGDVDVFAVSDSSGITDCSTIVHPPVSPPSESPVSSTEGTTPPAPKKRENYNHKYESNYIYIYIYIKGALGRL